MLTLSEALKADRLAEFVRQEEARGIGPAERKKLDKAIARLIKQPRLADRTSRSASGDGSTER